MMDDSETPTNMFDGIRVASVVNALLSRSGVMSPFWHQWHRLSTNFIVTSDQLEEIYEQTAKPTSDNSVLAVREIYEPLQICGHD